MVKSWVCCRLCLVNYELYHLIFPHGNITSHSLEQIRINDSLWWGFFSVNLLLFHSAVMKITENIKPEQVV